MVEDGKLRGRPDALREPLHQQAEANLRHVFARWFPICYGDNCLLTITRCLIDAPHAWA